MSATAQHAPYAQHAQHDRPEGGPMTYTAPTYYRTGAGPHVCPDSYPRDGRRADPRRLHMLVPHPEKNGGADWESSTVWVCPAACDHELSERHRAAEAYAVVSAALEALCAAARQKKEAAQ